MAEQDNIGGVEHSGYIFSPETHAGCQSVEAQRAASPQCCSCPLFSSGACASNPRSPMARGKAPREPSV